MRALAPGLFVALLPFAGSAATNEPVTFVACAPGYPGSTVEAQPVMDAFAAALAEAAGWGAGRLQAEYHEDEERGLARLTRADVAFALVPLPFFLKHETRLRLSPEAHAIPEGGRVDEAWSLVAAKGKVRGPQAIEGWELLTSAGYAPRFVRGPALGAWGGTAGARVIRSGAVLSGLRRAAAGEKVALLLDRAETDALSSLPFAKDLEVVTRSSPLPETVVCSLGGRVARGRVEELVKALLGLRHRPSGAAALAAMRTETFVPLQAESVSRARAAYAAAREAP